MFSEHDASIRAVAERTRFIERTCLPNRSERIAHVWRRAPGAQSIRHDSFNSHGSGELIAVVAKDVVAAMDVIVTMRVIVTMNVNVKRYTLYRIIYYIYNSSGLRAIGVCCVITYLFVRHSIS